MAAAKYPMGTVNKLRLPQGSLRKPLLLGSGFHKHGMFLAPACSSCEFWVAEEGLMGVWGFAYGGLQNAGIAEDLAELT